MVFRGKRPRIRTKREQKEGALPMGLVASAAAPLLGEIAKLIFKTVFGKGRRRRTRR